MTAEQSEPGKQQRQEGQTGDAKPAAETALQRLLDAGIIDLDKPDSSAVEPKSPYETRTVDEILGVRSRPPGSTSSSSSELRPFLASEAPRPKKRAAKKVQASRQSRTKNPRPAETTANTTPATPAVTEPRKRTKKSTGGTRSRTSEPGISQRPNSLPQELQKRIIELRTQRIGPTEIASITGVPPKTVEKRLRIAKDQGIDFPPIPTAHKQDTVQKRRREVAFFYRDNPSLSLREIAKQRGVTERAVKSDLEEWDKVHPEDDIFSRRTTAEALRERRHAIDTLLAQGKTQGEIQEILGITRDQYYRTLKYPNS